MHKLYEALLDQLRELHAGMLKTLDEMPAESLDWTPGPQMNSLSVLIVHLTGAERYWIGDVVKGEPSFRDRNAEFLVKGLDAAALKKRITDLDAFEAAALEPLGVAQLEQGRVSPRDGKLVTVAWALMHAVQHSAVHAGHIEILSQQWKQRKAP